jgi:hypothetical protein
MITQTFTGIEVIQLYSCYLDESTVSFLKYICRNKKYDALMTKELMVIHKESLLIALDEAPSQYAWDEAETIFEMMDTNNIDFLEIPVNICCQSIECPNKKIN